MQNVEINSSAFNAGYMICLLIKTVCQILIGYKIKTIKLVAWL